MNSVEAALHRTIAELSTADHGWALVGGLAVSARAEPRFTRDVDVAVAVTDDRDAERVVRRMIGSGYQLVASVEQDAVGRLATVRLIPEGDLGIVVDVLFASSGIETEIVAQAELLEILPDLIVPVARTGHLIALKVLARDDLTRPQDRDRTVPLNGIRLMPRAVRFRSSRSATPTASRPSDTLGARSCCACADPLAQPAGSSRAIDSTWWVIGNASNARNPASSYPSAANDARSRANVAGSQAT